MSVQPQGQVEAKAGEAVGLRDAYAIKMKAEEARSTGQLSRGSGCPLGSPVIGLLPQRADQTLRPQWRPRYISASV